jgi:uncharacterized membrane protein YeiB
MDEKSWVEKLPYPSGLVKWMYKSRILLYRLGLSFLVGRLFMIMTMVGRKSGQPLRSLCGPAEWLRRSLTYGKLQPIRRPA